MRRGGFKRWRCRSVSLSVCLSVVNRTYVRLVQKLPNQSTWKCRTILLGPWKFITVCCVVTSSQIKDGGRPLIWKWLYWHTSVRNLLALSWLLTIPLDKYAPVVIKMFRRKSKSNPRFTATITSYHRLILTSKNQYFSNLVSSVSDNQMCPWQTDNKLLHRQSSSPLPTSTPRSLLPVPTALLTSSLTKLNVRLHLSLLQLNLPFFYSSREEYMRWK